eukprot:TRINITY_DN49017_c0_g1_i1.p1 TRINITY_DN49017_c0_g1~~TRINITY_DN49017_c0_g1_i1.p1  ORF type:complete len:694 (+),score=243.67 TRINITY_DN49017_c0_g1_i1:63-2144(+)
MAMSKVASVALLAGLVAPGSHAVKISSSSEVQVQGNPVRKVIALLMKMGEKIEDEGRAEKKTYAKYSCWCSTTQKDLEADIARLTGPNIVQQSDIDELDGEKVKTQTEVDALQKEQDGAQSSLNAATAQREKDKAEFTEKSTDEKKTAQAAGDALAILVKSTKPALLQQKMKEVKNTQLLQKALMISSAPIDHKQKVLQLLAGQSAGESPDLATGILSEIKDTSERVYSQLVKAEEAAVESFLKLRNSKAQEIETLMETINRKNTHIGETSVKIVDLTHQLKDVRKSLETNRANLQETKVTCEAKAKAWEERQQIRSKEQLAVQETIDFLNSDAAHDLFEKTAGKEKKAALLQVANTDKIRQDALKYVKEAREHDSSPENINFLALALTSKKVDFSKVKEMIDNMIRLMRQQSKDDENKKEYCENAFYDTKRKQEIMSRDLKDVKISVADKKGDIALLMDESKLIQAGIDALAKSQKDAAETRAEEAKEFAQTVAENSAAVKLLKIAKNRLNKFYNPDAYVAKSEYDFLQVDQQPEAVSDTYTNSKDSTPVMGMISAIEADVTQEIKVAQNEEKFAIQAFKAAAEAAGKKTMADQIALETKQKAKADLEDELSGEQGKQSDKESELKAEEEVQKNLHEECDWTLANFEARVAARTKESESLKRAKASLNGADHVKQEATTVTTTTTTDVYGQR